MKGKSIKDFFNRKKIVASTCAVLSAALLIGGVAVVQDTINTIELASYVDPVLETSIEEEETPLASSPQVTTNSKTSTKTTTKNVTLKTASTKSYTKTLPTTSKTTTKTTKKDSNTTVKTQTTVKTAVTEKYTKKSKKKVVTTKVTTTVKTTTTVQVAQDASTQKAAYEVDVTKLAPKMDSKVISAFQTLGCKIVIDSSVNYSGYFEAKSKKITLKKEDDTVYHELGHFLAFITGNFDTTTSFKAIYNAEKSKYTGTNKAYVTQNSSEYFAESVRDYILNKDALKSARPQTYAAVEQALSKVTTAQVAKIKLVLSALNK
jgi:predicted DNA-binding protein